MGDLVITLGSDVGNSAIKIRHENGDSDVLPTMLDKVAVLSTYAESKDPMNQLDLEILQSKGAPTGRAFYGHLASETGNGKPLPLRAEKAKTPEVLMALVMSMAVAACRRLDAMKKADRTALLERARAEKRPLEITINLGTGLPLAEFKNDAVKKEFRRLIRGAHTVQFVTTPVWKDYGEIKLVVESLEVCAEGMAVLYDLVFDATGNLIDDRMAEGNVLINDIGAGTHDMPYYEGMDLRNALSKPYESKVNENMDAITEQVNHTYSRNLTRYDVERFIFSTRHPHAIPNGARDPISIRAYTEGRFRSLAALYAARTKQAFEDTKGLLTHVIMAGGGSAVAREFYEQELLKLNDEWTASGLPFKVVWLANAQMANASGYFKMVNEKVQAKAQKVAAAGD